MILKFIIKSDIILQWMPYLIFKEIIMQLTLKDRAGIYEGVCAVTKPIKTNVNIKVKVESNGNIHI